MEVEIRYFAAAREATGLESEALTVPEGSTVAALLEALCTRHPALAGPATSLRVALDTQFAAPGAVVPAGAVVALIPPVGGG